MKRHLFMLGLLFTAPAFAASTTPQDAQAQGQHRPPPFERKSWVRLTLDHRQDLGLTDAQAASLEQIQASLETKNAPVKQSLEALRPQPPAGGAQGARPSGPPPDDATREKVHGLFEQLRANDMAAWQEAQQVLTDAQKTQAQSLIQAQMQAHGRGPGGHGGPPQGPQ
jgi:hypothetical protein